MCQLHTLANNTCKHQQQVGKQIPCTHASTVHAHMHSLHTPPTAYLGRKQSYCGPMLPHLHRHGQHRLHYKLEKLQPPYIAPKRGFTKPLNAIGIQDAVLTCREGHVFSCVVWRGWSNTCGWAHAVHVRRPCQPMKHATPCMHTKGTVWYFLHWVCCLLAGLENGKLFVGGGCEGGVGGCRVAGACFTAW